MPLLNDLFDGDFVRPEYIGILKKIVEVKCSSYHWSFEHEENSIREGIRYRFDSGHVIWYIPSEHKKQQLFVSTEKLKQFLTQQLDS